MTDDSPTPNNNNNGNNKDEALISIEDFISPPIQSEDDFHDSESYRMIQQQQHGNGNHLLSLPLSSRNILSSSAV